MKPAGRSRILSVESAGDVALIRLMLRERVPVSSVFAVAAQVEMFLLNSVFDPDVCLSYLEEHEVIVAWKAEGASFQLLDIAGKTIPSLANILSALDQRPDRIEVCFPPDKLGWKGTSEPFVSDISLMVRGEAADLLSNPVMLSPMAEF